MKSAIRVIIHDEFPETLKARLLERHSEIVVQTCNTYSGLPGLIEGFQPDCLYSIRFAGSKNFPREAVFSENGPEWIHIGGSGTDHLGNWNPDVTTVTNSAGVAASMMAEFTIGCFLHFSLDIKTLQSEKSKRSWNPRILTPLRGKTVLIVGLGKTGRSIARLCSALEMKVLGTKANPGSVSNVDTVFHSGDLGRLLPIVDYIAVCLPLLNSTKNLFNHETFSKIKPGAVLVDLSRGGIVQQTALIESLNNGTLKAAALDVFETEPLPEDSTLWEIDNLLISPHSSSVFEGWQQDSLDIFSDNLSRLIAGKPLENIVDPARGY